MLRDFSKPYQRPPFTPDVPRNYDDVKLMKDAAKWQQATDAEIAQIERRGTYEILEQQSLRHDTPVLPSTIVYAKKRDGRYKARLVAGGHKQVTRLLYDFGSPTVSVTVLFLVLAVAVMMEWSIAAADITGAFLYPDVPESPPIYMWLPKGHPLHGKGKVAKLKKSLYGLKEAARLFYDLFSATLKGFGFKQSTYDNCCFLVMAA